MWLSSLYFPWKSVADCEVTTVPSDPFLRGVCMNLHWCSKSGGGSRVGATTTTFLSKLILY